MARCQNCRGVGSIVNPALPIRRDRLIAPEYFDPPSPPVTIPCPACGGSGIEHCCDGEVAQSLGG